MVLLMLVCIRFGASRPPDPQTALLLLSDNNDTKKATIT